MILPFDIRTSMLVHIESVASSARPGPGVRGNYYYSSARGAGAPCPAPRGLVSLLRVRVRVCLSYLGRGAPPTGRCNVLLLYATCNDNIGQVYPDISRPTLLVGYVH